MKAIYACLLTFVMMLPVALFAKSDSARVSFDHPMIIAGKKVPAGKYEVRWSGNGPAVQVRFLKNNKVVATAPAKLIEKKNPYDNAFEATRKNGSRVLTAIDRSNMTLKFSQNGSRTQASSE